MAIEIIRRGHLPENDRFEAQCHNCHTQIAFLRSDGKLTFDQRDGDFLTVDCPHCHRPVHVSTRKANVTLL